ncbi:MAG TPA: hypothetical protein VFJ74_06850 [Gemmatimonadaceae bacterium]|nr:hypothetical protein [Gemmatimonadaceae bacterium]
MTRNRTTSEPTSTQTTKRFEEDMHAVATTAVAEATTALERAREAISVALKELNYLRERGAAGIN